MDFLISRKVYAIIEGQHEAVFTLPVSLLYLWLHATLKEDITTRGKWRNQHWICIVSLLLFVVLVRFHSLHVAHTGL